MKFFYKLEAKFNRSNFPNLMIVFIGCYVTGYILNRVAPTALQFLWFDPYLILKGQIWRLVTFIFVPNTTEIFLALITCFIYISISKSLEQIIGRFRVNFFLISGVIIEAVFGLLYFFIFKSTQNVLFVVYLNPYYLYAMLFVLFALLYPDARFLFMFIFPIRGKFMVLITFAMYALDVFLAFTGGYAGYGWILVFMIVAAVLTLCLFVWLSGCKKGYGSSNKIRYRTSSGASSRANTKAPRHKCCVCGRTDLTNPELDFRYCSKCAGNMEYCSEHLYTHIHV